MSDEKKKEREVVPAVVEYDNKKSVVTNVGFGKGAETVYEIVFPIPQTKEEALERYGADLDYIIAAGIRQLTYRVDYPSVGFEADGTLKELGHESMQELADGYKVGRVSTGGSKAAVVKKAKDLESKFGNLDELAAKLAILKEQGLI